jgi:hypothetical protein
MHISLVCTVVVAPKQSHLTVVSMLDLFDGTNQIANEGLYGSTLSTTRCGSVIVTNSTWENTNRGGAHAICKYRNFLCEIPITETIGNA